MRLQHDISERGGAGEHRKTRPFFVTTGTSAEPHPEEAGLLGKTAEVQTKASRRERTRLPLQTRSGSSPGLPMGTGSSQLKQQSQPLPGRP